MYIITAIKEPQNSASEILNSCTFYGGVGILQVLRYADISAFYKTYFLIDHPTFFEKTQSYDEALKDSQDCDSSNKTLEQMTDIKIQISSSKTHI